MLCVGLLALVTTAGAAESKYAANPRITVLSTMLANFTGTGEWGFTALLETEVGAVLFDTGFKQLTVKQLSV